MALSQKCIFSFNLGLKMIVTRGEVTLQKAEGKVKEQQMGNYTCRALAMCFASILSFNPHNCPVKYDYKRN